MNLKILFVIAIFCLFLPEGHAQIPRLKKQDVSNSGAAIYIPGEPLWDVSVSEDGSTVFSTEVKSDSIVFGAIVVMLKEKLSSEDVIPQELLLSYMDFLNEQVFGIVQATEPGVGHTLDSNPEATGILLYGMDAAGFEYTLKGWADPGSLAVLYIKSKSEVNYNIQEMYLNGFRFPVASTK